MDTTISVTTEYQSGFGNEFATEALPGLCQEAVIHRRKLPMASMLSSLAALRLRRPG